MSSVIEEVFESGPVQMPGDYLSLSVKRNEWKAEKSSKTLNPDDFPIVHAQVTQSFAGSIETLELQQMRKRSTT